MKERLVRLWSQMSRRQAAPMQGGDRAETNMKDILSLLDLTLLGVGATLGTGVYILAGQTAHEAAGPAVFLSFLIAAVASFLAALCYAELASVVPSAGTAYTYSYVGIGEFPAFIVGWNLILEYAIGTASVARAFSSYLDKVSGSVIKDWSLRTVPLKGSFLAEYPGFLALGLITLLAVLLSLGVRESSMFTNVCTLFNLVTITVTIIAGGLKSDPENWFIARKDIPPTVPAALAGEGGFLPFGVYGVLAGAARCFFGYVGFDTITACGEEAKNPKRNIPLSILLTLITIFIVYLLVSVVATMMVPYYEQDADTPFPSAFQKVGLPVVSWIVTIGAMFALCTSMVGSLFPLPRVLLTMAADGMIFRFFGAVNARTGTSLRSTLLAWAISGSMAFLFNLEQLIEMMSIGTLMAYIVVAVSVVQIRYRVDGDGSEGDAPERPKLTALTVLKAMLNYQRVEEPSNVTSWVVTVAQLLFSAYLLTQSLEFPITTREIACIVGILILILIITLCIALQPRAPKIDQSDFTFKTPLVPFLPYLSILINMSLMMLMKEETWTRFGAWLLIGLITYFCYSVRCSTLAEIQSLQSKPRSQDNSHTLNERPQLYENDIDKDQVETQGTRD